MADDNSNLSRVSTFDYAQASTTQSSTRRNSTSSAGMSNPNRSTEQESSMQASQASLQSEGTARRNRPRLDYGMLYLTASHLLNQY